MSTDDSRATTERYLDALVQRGDFGRFFAADVVVTIEGTDQRVDGAEAAEGIIRYLHEQAFDGTLVRRGLIVDGGQAVLEADFVGRHVGEFAGVPATGRDVRVPYTVVYDVADDGIRALRIYLAPERIVAQLTATPAMPEAAAGTR